MLQVTLYQMRKNVGRLTAAGIAILIGTAFVAATFVAGQLLVATSTNAMTTEFGDSDMVVLGDYQKDSGNGSMNRSPKMTSTRLLARRGWPLCRPRPRTGSR